MGLRNLLWLTLVAGTAICGLWLVVADDDVHELEELGQWVTLDDAPELNRFKRAIAPASGDRSGFTHDSCFNVSKWSKVTYINITREKCDTTFEKECEPIEGTVCDDVPGMNCEIVPYTDCNMTMDMITYNVSKPVYHDYLPWECSNNSTLVPHTKMIPECWNETRKNCLTEWQQLPDGTEVWDPQGGPCEEVVWQRCELKPKQVMFKQPTVHCTKGEPIRYNDCEEVPKERMVNGMKCEPRHSLNCRPTNSRICKTISYMNCIDKPKKNCTEQTFQKPHQEFLHRKKCLLPDPNDPHHAEREAKKAAAPAPAPPQILPVPVNTRGGRDGDGGSAPDNVHEWRTALGFA